MSVHLSPLTAQRLPRVSLHKGWRQVLREPNAALDLEGLDTLEDEMLPDLDEDKMDDDQRQEPNDPPQATPAQTTKLKTEVKEEDAKPNQSLALELEMEETYPDACDSPGWEVIEAIVPAPEKRKPAEPSAVEESKKAEEIEAEKTEAGTTAKPAEPSAVEESKKAEEIEAEKTEAGTTAKPAEPPAVEESKKAEEIEAEKTEAGTTAKPAEPSAVEESKKAEVIEAEKTEAGTTAKPAEPSAVEESKKAEEIASVEAAASAEAEKTGNGAGGKDSGEAGGTLAPAGVTTAKEAEPSAVEKSKKAEGLTLPKAAPSAEGEKTGNGGGKDSGEAAATPAAGGVTTAKSAEPSAKQGAGALDESNPKGAEASVSDGFEQQGLATAKKKDIRSLETVFFVHHWVTALASLSKHCFLLCICHLLIDRRALTSQVWLLTFLLRRHHRQCVHLQLRLRQAQAQAQARFARTDSERMDF